jgi:hypothetical protein
MIPKTIHYCWFGNKAKPEVFNRCLESWRRFCPDYTVREWNSENFLSESAFFRNTIAEGKYAFASDYARAHVLAEHGGVYVDTDVELVGPLDRFLVHGAFSAFETVGLPFTAVWASVAGHPWPKRISEWYDRQADTAGYLTNTALVSDLLVRSWGVDPARDELQLLDDGIAIYPSTTFCVPSPHSVAIHHFEGSWLKDGNTRYPYGDVLRDRLLIREVLLRNGYPVAADKRLTTDYMSLGQWSVDRLGRKDVMKLMAHCIRRVLDVTWTRFRGRGTRPGSQRPGHYSN